MLEKTLDVIFYTMVVMATVTAVVVFCDWITDFRENDCNSEWVDYDHTYRDGHCYIRTIDDKWIKESNYLSN